MRRNSLGALLVGLTLLLSDPRTASASLTTYAPSVQDHLHLEAEPGCTLCHEDNKGGDGTATKPFGESIRAFGASGDEDVGSLLYALDSMDQYDVDGDGDGVHDLDELRRGTDPNDGTDPPPPPPPPATGEGGDSASTSATTSSESDGSSLNESTGAGGTRSDRPPPPQQSSLVPEMKSGCTIAATNRRAGAGTLLILAGFAGVARWRTTARRGRRGACSTPPRNDWLAGRRSRRST